MKVAIAMEMQDVVVRDYPIATAPPTPNSGPVICDAVAFAKAGKSRFPTMWIELIWRPVGSQWFVRRRWGDSPKKLCASESDFTAQPALACEWYGRQIQLIAGDGYVVVGRHSASWAPTKKLWETLDHNLLESADFAELCAAELVNPPSLRNIMHRDSDW